MTNPTTPFSWQMPTSTDLVTDLPADFETFGQAVATSMADLLGGTTGQMLTKATNTDMDFTWVTPQVGDITAVTVTSPITGGGTSGSVGIAYDYAAGSKVTTQAQTGTTYTFVLADADQKLVTASNASAQTYSIPTNASVAFPIGTVINIIQIGAGQVTIQAVTSGTTTVLSNGATAAAPKLRVQYSAASLIKVATDTWYVVGDIA
jgi:hypothetical protein